MNQTFHLSPPTPVTTPANLEAKESRWSALKQYRAQTQNAKYELACKMRDAFEILDAISETEFLEVMKSMSDDGVSACDMLEKFRKWKGL